MGFLEDRPTSKPPFRGFPSDVDDRNPSMSKKCRPSSMWIHVGFRKSGSPQSSSTLDPDVPFNQNHLAIGGTPFLGHPLYDVVYFFQLLKTLPYG